MSNYIIDHLDHPIQLEKFFREDKAEFTNQFNKAYPLYKENLSMQIWNERLNYSAEKKSIASKNEIIIIIVLLLIGGMISNIPNISGINDEKFFSTNISFIIFPILSAYYIWKQKFEMNKMIAPFLAIIISAVYINLIPENTKSNSSMLACIHLPLFLWSILGYAYIGGDLKNQNKKIEFLKFNGDLVVISAIILLSCMLFTGVTVGLFSLIDIKIEVFYFQYIAIWWIAGIPMIGTYLIQNNPQIINKVSPIIAKIFTPLVFINLLVYLSALIYTGKYPYNDRNLLLIFNALLIGVMALILFSVAEAGNNKKSIFSTLLLFGLSFLTIIINSIALAAISYRLIEYGITPNRIAVLGGNILIFIHLSMVCYKLFKSIRSRSNLEVVETSIALFLPIYSIWTGIVIFLLPFIFKYK